MRLYHVKSIPGFSSQIVEMLTRHEVKWEGNPGAGPKIAASHLDRKTYWCLVMEAVRDRLVPLLLRIEVSRLPVASSAGWPGRPSLRLIS